MRSLSTNTAYIAGRSDAEAIQQRGFECERWALEQLADQLVPLDESDPRSVYADAVDRVTGQLYDFKCLPTYGRWVHGGNADTKRQLRPDVRFIIVEYDDEGPRRLVGTLEPVQFWRRGWPPEPTPGQFVWVAARSAIEPWEDAGHEAPEERAVTVERTARWTISQPSD